VVLASERVEGRFVDIEVSQVFPFIELSFQRVRRLFFFECIELVPDPFANSHLDATGRFTWSLLLAF
jgi:hypothetical protein